MEDAAVGGRELSRVVREFLDRLVGADDLGHDGFGRKRMIADALEVEKDLGVGVVGASSLARTRARAVLPTPPRPRRPEMLAPCLRTAACNVSNSAARPVKSPGGAGNSWTATTVGAGMTLLPATKSPWVISTSPSMYRPPPVSTPRLPPVKTSLLTLPGVLLGGSITVALRMMNEM